MRCLDFDLKLYGDERHGFFVELLSSPLQCRSEPAKLVLPDDIASRISKLRRRQGDRQDSKDLGLGLFAALLPSRIRDIWNQSRGLAREADIIRLRLDIRANELTAIPWEIIHDGSEYLALSARSPLVRYLHNNASLRHVEHSGPVNVLLVTATPDDLPPLPGVPKELETIRRSFKSLKAGGKVERLNVLEHATSENLHATLSQSYQLVHYMGHGAFIDNRGYLFLENEAGRSSWKEAETIGDLLKNNAIRLLVLNACDTAIPSPEKSLIGVAHAAHAAGVPAVVAMQQTILDRAAIEFARAFYLALNELKPLEACLTAGRLAVKNLLGPDSAEWAIPVLFSNAPTGTLCRIWAAKEKRSAKNVVINAEGATGPIILGNVGRDAIGTMIVNEGLRKDEYDSDV